MADTGPGAAGRGAREQARRAGAKVEEARRQLAAAEKAQRAWELGADGEVRTADVLHNLEYRGWRILHDVHWPGRPRANIDHIAVGPGGIFVIDSKHWSGRVDVRDGVLRQNGYPRLRECEAAVDAAAAVAALLEPRHRLLTTPLLCLVGQETPAEQPAQVRVLGLADLPDSLQQASPVLAEPDVDRIAGYLRRTLAGEHSPGVRVPAARPARPHSAPRGPTRRAQPRRSREAVMRTIGVGLVKLALLVLLVLVVLPTMIRSATSSIVDGIAPANPTPSSTAPAAGP